MLKRYLFLTCLAALLATDAAGADAARRAPERGQRALWVWRPSFLESEKEMSGLLQFARLRNIRTLFLFTSTRRLENDPEAFRRLLRRAHRRRMTVQALNGEPHWIFPEQRDEPRAFLKAVEEFNRESSRDARFDAIHLDVEPQSLPEWKAETSDRARRKLAELYLDFVTWSRRHTREIGIPLALDIPVAFNRIRVESGPLVEALLERADQLAVMAYKDEVSEVLNHAAPALHPAGRMGKKVWVGLSADPADLPRPPAGQLLEKEIEKIARQVERSLKAQPSFQGVAIHDYDAYRRALCRPGRECDAPLKAAKVEASSRRR